MTKGKDKSRGRSQNAKRFTILAPRRTPDGDAFLKEANVAACWNLTYLFIYFSPTQTAAYVFPACLWQRRDECDSCHTRVSCLCFRHSREWWDLKRSSSVSLINPLSCLPWTRGALTDTSNGGRRRSSVKYCEIAEALIQFKREWKVSWCAWVNNSTSLWRKKRLTDGPGCVDNLEDINYPQTL